MLVYHGPFPWIVPRTNLSSLLPFFRELIAYSTSSGELSMCLCLKNVDLFDLFLKISGSGKNPGTYCLLPFKNKRQNNHEATGYYDNDDD